MHGKVLPVTMKTLRPDCYFQIICSARIITVLFILSYTWKLHGFSSGQRGCHILMLIVLSPETLCKQCIELFALWAVVLPCWKWHRFFNNWTGVQKWCKNMCFILVWIYGLGKNGPVNRTCTHCTPHICHNTM